MHIITLANRKGGVSKTTSIWALGHALAQAGHRVLLVDADSQSNLTRCLPAVDPSRSLTQLIEKDATLAQVMQPVGERLWLVASTDSLAAAEKALGLEVTYPFLFRNALDGLEQVVDYVLIDTPPTPNSPLTMAALTAANKVYIPTLPEVFSFDGMASLLDLVKRIQKNYNPNLVVGGIFICKYAASYRKSLHHEFAQMIQDRFGSLLLNSTIHDTVSVAEAQVRRLSLYEWAPQSTALADYEALTQEIVAAS